MRYRVEPYTLSKMRGISMSNTSNGHTLPPHHGRTNTNNFKEQEQNAQQVGFITKNAWIYARMKDDIARGVLAPGERLVVARIAQRYNVSPMPVRDALNRLSQEGFVEITPHAGATVISVDLDQLREILVVRHELEPLAAALSVDHIDSDMLLKLERMHTDMERLCAANNEDEYEAMNWAFHDIIYASSRNRTLYELIMSLWRRSCITRTVFARLPDKLPLSVEGHRQWLNGIREKNAVGVRRIVHDHLKLTMSLLGQIDEHR